MKNIRELFLGLYYYLVPVHLQKKDHLAKVSVT